MTKQKVGARKGRPNLRSVAEHIKLSPATVSLALRGDASIPPETRERVLAAAEELNYEYVSRVKKKDRVQLRRIAFVMHDYGDRPITANPFYGHILCSTEQVCREKHVSLSFVIVHHDHPVSDMLPPVLTHDVDGIILASPYPPSLIRRVSRESPCPVVLIDNFFPGCPHDSVMADDFGGAYQAVAHLAELGHRHIGMLTGYAQNLAIIPSFQERYRGYAMACEESSLEPIPQIVVPALVDPHPEYDIDTMTAWVKELLERSPEMTAFFGASDRFALAFIAALHRLGVEVPEKLSVVGFDDIPDAQIWRTPLSTVHSHRDFMAELAVTRLLERMDGDDSPPQYAKIGTELILRNSTASPS